MPCRYLPQAALLAGVVLLALTPPSAHAQRLFGGRSCDCPCPPPPCLTPAEKPPTAVSPDQTPQIPPAAAMAPSATPEFASPLGGELFAANMIGDFLAPGGGLRRRAILVPGNPICTTIPGQIITVPGKRPPQVIVIPPTVVCVPGPQQVQFESFSIPSSSHSFKIADNQNVLPDNRIFFNYNYYNNVGDIQNARTGADVGQVDVHREVFGFEKTFLDGRASILLALPINTLDADGSRTAGLGGTSTDVGDLTVAVKVLLWRSSDLGLALGGGLAVTLPTGPSGFAGSEAVGNFHETTLQPFLGYLWQRDALFFHGFTSIDFPTDSRDVTLLFNDLGVGYFVYRNHGGDRLITDIAPTFEVHVNTPLNHRGLSHGPSGTPDWVDLVGAASVVFEGGSTLAIGIGAPITGPRPYDLEALVQLNIRF